MNSHLSSSPEALPTETPPLWRRLLPACVAALLIAYVATRIDFHAFARAVARTNHLQFIGLGLIFNAALLTADTFATNHVYRRVVGPVRYRELFAIRGASYLPSMLNYHVGQAWLTYFLARAYKAPLSRAAGATLIVYTTTFGALFTFLLVGLPLNHGRTTWFMPTVVVILVGGVLFALILAIKPRALAKRALFAPVFEAGLGGHVVEFLFRLPHMLVQFLGTWLPFELFGVHVPFADALALMPVVLFAVALPISPQGLGTRDALAITLLSSYAIGTRSERASMIAASTLSWVVMISIMQLFISLMFMRRAHRLLGRA